MVTIIAGTNRPKSSTLNVAKYYQKTLAQKGLQANVLSLTQLPDNIIVSDLYGSRSPEFNQIQQLITDTSKFLFVIPEYNGSFPGVLKVFMDACSFPQSFYDKRRHWLACHRADMATFAALIILRAYATTCTCT